MRTRLFLLVAFVVILGAFNEAYPASPVVTIRSLSFPSKVHPNEQFSVDIIFVCSDANGWVKARLYLKDQELKASDGIWIGLLGKETGKNVTATLSGIVLEPNKEPYMLQVVMFWQPLTSLLTGEIKQDSKELKIAVVSITLSVDCLPKSVNSNENFLLQCSIMNEGNDIAQDIVAEITDYKDFSPKGELRESIGKLEPGQAKTAFFNLSSPFVIFGSVRMVSLRLTYLDWTNKQYMIPEELSIKVDASPVELASTWGPMAILVTALVVFALFVLFRARRATVSGKGLEFRR